MPERLASSLDKLGCPAGAGFLLALSGGPDSTAMLRLFAALRGERRLRLEAAHLHHGLRGAEADRDAALAERACARAGIPFRLFRFDVEAFARRRKLSLETAGREIRHHFLRRHAAARKLDYVALAHHADDQAETVLMNLLRGAGPRGLAGIPPRRGIFIHPMLDFTKKEILDYLNEAGISYGSDATNGDLRHFRNQVRGEILPYLERESGLPFRRGLARMAAILREEEEWLSGELAPLLERRLMPLGYGVSALRISAGELPAPVERRLIRLFLERALGTLEGISFSGVETARELLRGETGKRYCFSGGVIEKTADGLAFSRGGETWSGETQLTVPGVIRVKALGFRLEAALHDVYERKEGGDAAQGETFLDYDRLESRVILRTRREGDFLHPPGMRGRKKLQDYFTDKKVPKILRDRIPLLAGDSEIFWVGGYGPGEPAKVTGGTRRILKLRLHHE